MAKKPWLFLAIRSEMFHCSGEFRYDDSDMTARIETLSERVEIIYELLFAKGRKIQDPRFENTFFN